MEGLNGLLERKRVFGQAASLKGIGSLIVDSQGGLIGVKVDGHPNALLRFCLRNCPRQIQDGDRFVQVNPTHKVDLALSKRQLGLWQDEIG